MDQEIAQDVIAIAASKIDGALFRDSAELCLADARQLAAAQPGAACRRAIRSLQHSVGVFHPAYKKAERIYIAAC